MKYMAAMEDDDFCWDCVISLDLAVKASTQRGTGLSGIFISCNGHWITYYWIEIISDSIHPKVMLCSRCVKFHKSLVTSRKVYIQA